MTSSDPDFAGAAWYVSRALPDKTHPVTVLIHLREELAKSDVYGSYRVARSDGTSEIVGNPMELERRKMLQVVLDGLTEASRQGIAKEE